MDKKALLKKIKSLKYKKNTLKKMSNRDAFKGDGANYVLNELINYIKNNQRNRR